VKARSGKRILFSLDSFHAGGRKAVTHEHWKFLIAFEHLVLEERLELKADLKLHCGWRTREALSIHKPFTVSSSRYNWPWEGKSARSSSNRRCNNFNGRELGKPARELRDCTRADNGQD